MSAPPPLLHPDGAPIGTPQRLRDAQASWRCAFARNLYGIIPPLPEVSIERHPLREVPGAMRLACTLKSERSAATLDAALFLPDRHEALGPSGQGAPVPLIVGLGFLGPAGVLSGSEFPLDTEAVVGGNAALGLEAGRPADHIRGVHAARWPLGLFRAAGAGLLLVAYGSVAPDCPDRWNRQGVAHRLGVAGEGTTAIALWAFGFRLGARVARALPEVDAARVFVAGHSRLGKAALFAAAQDEILAGLFVNEAGCGGTALASVSRGETLREMAGAFPHWVLPAVREGRLTPETDGLDQHNLMAAVAPRRLVVGSAAADDWADPEAEWMGVRAASPAWEVFGEPPVGQLSGVPGSVLTAQGGALAYHRRPGGHDLMPEDWRHALTALLGPSRQ